jgi:hypothetical protein
VKDLFGLPANYLEFIKLKEICTHRSPGRERFADIPTHSRVTKGISPVLFIEKPPMTSSDIAKDRPGTL